MPFVSYLDYLNTLTNDELFARLVREDARVKPGDENLCREELIDWLRFLPREGQ